MAHLNKVMLIGNVGKDPEIREVGTNKVANFTLATTYRANGNDNTEWHNIVAWGRQAEIVEQYVRKGSPLFIEGTIRTRSWEDQQGGKRYTTEIMANIIQLLGGRTQQDVEDDLPA